MDELDYMLLTSYEADELVKLFEVGPDEFLIMLSETYPEKLEEHMHKFKEV